MMLHPCIWATCAHVFLKLNSTTAADEVLYEHTQTYGGNPKNKAFKTIT